MDSAIETHCLVKTFDRTEGDLTVFRELRRLLRGTPPTDVLYALNDINLQVCRGEWIGVVGNNGSGKTTLTKLIARLYLPTSGTVRVAGDVSLLCGLGVGMVDDLSVRENVYLYGALQGIDPPQLRAQFDEIIHWADLDDFVSATFRTLSSGMRSRLAFSVARYNESRIVVQDEALTAGDKDFALKCKMYFQGLRQDTRTFVFSTHDLAFVSEFCDKTLWLSKGQQMAFDETARVLKEYRSAHG